jgi:hypothetical protein
MSQNERKPFHDSFSSLEPFFRLKGLVCDKGGKIENTYQRPRFNRANRAELYKMTRAELHKGEERDKEMIKKLLSEAKEEDYLIKQYLTQERVEINLPKIGKMSSLFTEIKPKKITNEIPIFLIPGMSNDIECVGSLLIELAKAGRRVICLGYPESYQGNTSKEFVKALKGDYSYDNHKQYFKEAIKKIIPNEKLDLYGVSTGGGISMQLLLDSEIQPKINQSVMICPTNITKLTLPGAIYGSINEFYHLGIVSFDKLSQWEWISGQKDHRSQIQYEEAKMIASPFNKWSEIKTPISMFIYTNDKITNGIKYKQQEEINNNPQIKVHVLKGPHFTSLIKPQFLVKYINAHQ